MKNLIFIAVLLIFSQCKKSNDTSLVPGDSLNLTGTSVNGRPFAINASGVNSNPTIKLNFTAPIERASASSIVFQSSNGAAVNYSASFSDGDSSISIQPLSALLPASKYDIVLLNSLKSTQQASLSQQISLTIVTAIDSSDKFPIITDDQLLTLVQQQTFNYFWTDAHPISGMARERNSSGDIVTTGGTGFGIMAIPVAISRNFITRSEGLGRMTTIVNFLKNNCTKFHGAFSHWINGSNGETIPFSTNDNGADLVETSYLMEGLTVARQYFSGTDPAEVSLRSGINSLLDAVEWNWFRKSAENVLYWHWSPNLDWVMNAQVRGWNEALITYVMASSSRTDSIPRIVYDNGWAGNGSIRNGNTYYGYQLPLGPSNGGPLFFEHYSFMGINPKGLNDAYANYDTQTINHTKINYEYCKVNPRRYYGYSDMCWGLTASDVPNGYNANEPNNDKGIIAPTAALSSFPYTPVESMKALKFFYYTLGDKLWGPNGFYDAFSLQEAWFANSTLAIDQGPIIVMIENYRTGMIWNLFTSSPEIKNGLRRLGFTAPYL